MKYINDELKNSIIQILIAAFLSSIIIYILGENPLAVISMLFSSTFGSLNGFLYTLFYSTPFIFTGLAVGLGFRGGLFNIGAEGQLYVGAFTASIVPLLFPNLPGLILIPVTIILCMISGGVWGFIPGFLKGKYNAHEVITTIMMNFIGIGLVGYFTTKYFKDITDPVPQTISIHEEAWLPRASDLFSLFGVDIPAYIPLNIAFVFAIVLGILVYIYLWKTVFGYNHIIFGSSPQISSFSGINPKYMPAVILGICGAIASLVGVNEVLGNSHRFILNFSPGYGFTGIAIALMGRNHPLGIILSALLFGALARGTILIDINFENITKDVIYIFQGILILLVSARSFKDIKQPFKKILGSR